MFGKKIKSIFRYLHSLILDHRLAFIVLCIISMLSIALGVVWASRTKEYLSIDMLTNFFGLIVYSGGSTLTFVGRYILLLGLGSFVVTVIPYGKFFIMLQSTVFSYIIVRLSRDGICGVVVFGWDGIVSLVVYYFVTIAIVSFGLIACILIRHDGGYTCGGIFNRYTVEGAYFTISSLVIWIVYVIVVSFFLKIIL